MTKIRNTKKGMAKKTLSISLAVAMLATSNVPVWAAEDLFTDGSVVEFTAEAEAPVEVVEEAPVVEESVAEKLAVASSNKNVTVDVKLPSNILWGNTLTTKGSIKDENGNNLSNVKYVWKDASTGLQLEGNGMSGSLESGKLPLLYVDKALAGKQIVLYLYRNDGIGYDFEATTNSMIVDAKDISNYEFDWNDEEIAAAVYDGKTSYKIAPVSAGLPNDGSTWNVLDEYNVNISYDRKNDDFVSAGKVNVTATAKGPAYVGSIHGSYEIAKKDQATADDVSAKFKDGVSFVYTGNNIDLEKMDNSKDFAVATDKHTNADMSGEVDFVRASGRNVGTHGGSLYFDTEKLKNYKNNVLGGLRMEGTFEITQRDLASDTKISVKPFQYKDNGAAFTANEILSAMAFTDNEGNALNLSNDVEVVLNGEVAKVGTYTVTVKAKNNGAYLNTKNEQNVQITVEQNAIKEYALGTATEANGHVLNKIVEFTNAEVTFKKEDLGDLYIKGRTGDGKLISTNCWDIKGYENNVHAGKATILIELKNNSGYDGKVLPVYFNIKTATVTADTVKAADKVVYNRDIADAAEYKPSVTVTAKNGAWPAQVFTLTEGTDYTLSYKFTDANGNKATNAVGNYVETTVKITNKDFGKGTEIKKYSKISYKSLTTENIVINPTSYVYTGGVITPQFKVVDDGKELYESTHYTVVDYTKSPDVGTATLTIKGIPAYGYDDTEAKATYEITAAKAEDVEVSFLKKFEYTGKPVYPKAGEFKVTLNGNDVTNQFHVDYDTNINAGTDAGAIVLTPKKGNLNFTGSKKATFDIEGKKLTGSLKVYNEKGVEISNPDYYFTYDGTAKQFSTVKFAPSIAGLAEGTDYEIKYAHNVYGKAYVYVVGKGNYVGTQSITYDNTTIKDVIASKSFEIKPLRFFLGNATVKNGSYAGGLPVKPVVTVNYKGTELVEGKDFKLELSGDDDYTEVTTGGTQYEVIVRGINGFAGSYGGTFKWGIDKFDLANADIIVSGTDVAPVVKVMNRTVVVDPTNYTLEVAEGKVTVTATKDNKNYTGTQTVAIKEALEKPETPMIVDVKVDGNKATVVLSGESDGAIGYDYVIGAKDCIETKDYVKVNKNKLTTDSTFTYTQQGQYYAYCHAWTRDENGKKVFSDWSNGMPFMVSAVTPDTPVITGYKVSGNTVTVTYTKAANATGYDVVLGSEYATIADEKRPVKYGELVKKNINGNTVTATFKNVPAGTYYAGLHAFNRTSEDGKKVFSPWSNIRTIRVK